MPAREDYSPDQFGKYLNREDTLEVWRYGMSPEEQESFIHFQLVQGNEPGMDPYL